ncbi:MAG TPA: hypothetical protein VHC86_04310 [Opitutaceae bacterium]|nr:hypothetical protein [Opitutaceae bacterium]
MRLALPLRRAPLALLVLAAGPGPARATDDGGDLYEYQYDNPGGWYESASAGDSAWQDSSSMFWNDDPAPSDPPEDGGGGGAPADPAPADPPPDPAPPPPPDPPPPSDPAPEPPPTPDPPPPDPPPEDPPPFDPPPPDPPAPDPAPAPPADPPPAPPAPPPFDRARVRFDSLGTGGGSAGSSFVATDPAGLGASPWPTFQNAQPARVIAQPVALPAPPAAAH